MKKLWGLLSAQFKSCLAILLLSVSELAFAADTTGGGISTVASSVLGNLGSLAQLITAGSYVAGFAFGVAAIVKFKAHKDNPTQVMISQPIVLLFVAAALIFIPSVFQTTGGTLFGSGTSAPGVAGTSTL